MKNNLFTYEYNIIKKYKWLNVSYEELDLEFKKVLNEELEISNEDISKILEKCVENIFIIKFYTNPSFINQLLNDSNSKIKLINYYLNIIDKDNNIDLSIEKLSNFFEKYHIWINENETKIMLKNSLLKEIVVNHINDDIYNNIPTFKLLKQSLKKNNQEVYYENMLDYYNEKSNNTWKLSLKEQEYITYRINSKDRNAALDLVYFCLPLIKKNIDFYKKLNFNFDEEEMYQVIILKLHEAFINKFSNKVILNNRNNNIYSYAYKCIGNIAYSYIESIRNNKRSLKKRNYISNYIKFYNKFGHVPTVENMAKILNISLNESNYFYENFTGLSLIDENDLVKVSKNDKSINAFEELIECSKLDDKEIKLLNLRLDGFTYEQIGKIIGCSKKMVYYFLTRIVNKIKNSYNDFDDTLYLKDYFEKENIPDEKRIIYAISSINQTNRR